MPRRLISYFPGSVRPFLDRNLHLIGYVLVVAVAVVACVLAVQAGSTAGEEAARAQSNAVRIAGRRAFLQIERSRVEQTRRGCDGRNEDRRVARRQINRQIRQTKSFPPSIFRAFGISRRRALRNLRRDRRDQHGIDCAKAVAEVRRTSPNFAPPLKD